MTYDKNSFLAGIAVGRQMKGWGAGDGGDAGQVPGFGDLRAWSAHPDDSWVLSRSCADGVNSLAIRAAGGKYEKLYFRLTGLVPPGSVGALSFRLTTEAYATGGFRQDGGFLVQSISGGSVTGELAATEGFPGSEAVTDRIFRCAAAIPAGEVYAVISFWDVLDGLDHSFTISDLRFRYRII